MKSKRLFKLSAIFLGIFLIGILEFQYIYSYINTPSGKVFLGTIHYPPDYFNYLTNIIQGEKNFLKSTVLYTQEEIPENYLRWPFVLMGKVHKLTGISVAQTYNLATVFFLATLLWATWIFLKQIFPENPGKQLLAFLFFTTSTAWPGYTHWYNTGDLFIRFSKTPHHLLSNTLLIVSFIFLINTKAKFRLPFLIILGFLTASLSPTHYFMTGGAAFFAQVFLNFVLKKRLNLFPFLPCFAFIAGGIPSSIYIYLLHKTEPYNAVAIWEKSQQLKMSLKAIFLGSGLISVFAGLGLYPLFIKRNFRNYFALSFIIFSLIFCFLPIPIKLGMSNARFWPQTLYIFFAIAGVKGIYIILTLFKRYKEQVLTTLLFIYILTIIPSIHSGLLLQMNDKSNNSFFYIGKDAFETYEYVHENISAEGIFLMPWVLNESFPAFTGKRVYYGDSVSHLTINADEKMKNAFLFLDGKMGGEETKTFFDKGKIKYVLDFHNALHEKNPLLKKIYTNGNMDLYEVEARI